MSTSWQEGQSANDLGRYSCAFPRQSKRRISRRNHFFFDGGKGGAREEREARAEVSSFRRIPEVDIVGDWLIAI